MIEIVENMINQELEDLHTAAPARIEKYDPERMIAEITLLYKNKNEILPPIIEVPVTLLKAGSFIIRPPYKSGDIVLVVFSERSLDYILNLAPQDPKCKTKHRIDDAMIVSGIRIDAQGKLSSAFINDLLMQNTFTGDYFVMKESGGFIMKSFSDITLDAEGQVNTISRNNV